MPLVSTVTRNPLALIILAMVLYVGIALLIDIEKVSRIALKIDYWTVPLILTPMTLDIFLLAFRFHRLLQALNVKIPLAKSIL
ncbi:MAG: hypothetical protein ACR2IS_18675, partial [Nitrososphaeraceae archaeon]